MKFKCIVGLSATLALAPAMAAERCVALDSGLWREMKGQS